MYPLCSKTLSSELQLHYGLRSNVVWAHMHPHSHTYTLVVGIDVRAFILANTLGSFNVIKSQGKTKVGKTNRWYTAATALKSEPHSPDIPNIIHALNY